MTKKIKLRLADIPKVAAEVTLAVQQIEEPEFPWTKEERELHFDLFRQLFWLDPKSKDEGLKWLADLKELTLDIVADATAYHNAKCAQAAQATHVKLSRIAHTKARIEELRQKKPKKVEHNS